MKSEMYLDQKLKTKQKINQTPTLALQVPVRLAGQVKNCQPMC